MFTRLTYTRNIAKSLLYNEHKIQEKKCECIGSENFLKDTDSLTHRDKLAHFNRIVSLNQEATVKAIHVYMTFHPSEKLSNGQMQVIAKEYMQKIRLQDQPFLIYRHYDTNHPHLHIVSTNIQPDGKQIQLRDILFGQSRRASEELTEKYSLVKFEKRIGSEEDQAPVKSTQKIRYGKAPTVHAIRDVLTVVMGQYKFTTLKEFNAVLGLYNVAASGGKEGSYLHQHRGLIYTVIDESGAKQSLPIKASTFEFKPTLKNLEKKFVLNETLREPHSLRIRAAIDWTLLKGPHDLEEFQKAMEKERISVVLPRDKDGSPQGIYYIDHQNRTVFDGQSLGEKYHVRNIRKRCVEKQDLTQVESQVQRQRPRLDLY